MTKLCKMCGKEIIRTDREVFCSQQCAYKYKTVRHGLVRILNRLAKQYDFELDNIDKIVNAKMMLFGRHGEDVKRCPCDANNPKRFCGSTQCIADTVYHGHCHCRLFWFKNVDNVDNV